MPAEIARNLCYRNGTTKSLTPKSRIRITTNDSKTARCAFACVHQGSWVTL